MSTGTIRIAQVVGAISGAAAGVPRAVAWHAKAVAQHGVHVTIFCGFSSKCPLTPEHFGLEGYEIVASPLWGSVMLSLAPRAFLELSRRAREFDVIHLNGVWNLATYIGAQIARAHKVPYVITPHSQLGRYHFSRYPLLKRILFAAVEKSNIRNASSIHVTSEWELQASSHCIPPERTVKIPLPIELSDLLPPIPRGEARTRLGLAGGFLVVSLGRVARQKNPLLLLDAFLQANLPAKACLAFVGPAESSLRRQLQDRVHSAGAGPRVMFVDYVEGADRRYWLSAADVFALSSFDENFCIAAMECAASGTYCLVSPHVGAVEYLPADRVRVVPMNAAEWSQALHELSRQPPRQVPLPPACVNRLTPAVVGAEWMSFYRRLLSSKHRAPGEN